MPDEQRFFFLDLRAANVKGGCTKTDHEDWLELDDWSFSMSQTAEPNVKGGAPTKTSATGTFSFLIKHHGPSLFKNCTSGEFIDQAVTFQAERSGLKSSQAAGAKATGTYFELIFTKTVVSGRNLSGDDGLKSEYITLAFETVQMTYRPVVNGALGTAITKKYDSKANHLT